MIFMGPQHAAGPTSWGARVTGVTRTLDTTIAGGITTSAIT